MFSILFIFMGKAICLCAYLKHIFAAQEFWAHRLGWQAAKPKKNTGVKLKHLQLNLVTSEPLYEPVEKKAIIPSQPPPSPRIAEEEVHQLIQREVQQPSPKPKEEPAAEDMDSRNQAR